MTSPHWDRLKELFAAATPIAAAEREKFLREQGADDALLQEVLAMLRAHPPSDGRGLGDDTAPPAPAGASTTEGPGSRIGPYKLLECIGEGGFGVVFAAEQQQPIRRRVALKVVKPGMDSAQVVARFEQERQALALMDHPHIARVFDGGATPSGRPFFVMELVKGDPITDYCNRERLSPAERMALFADVGRAVQHAHQKGVIHRDLKPSNVLVTLVDGRAVPKVIDFGVAKATQGRLTERTLFTEHKQMIGTPLYMSPEQAHISGVDVDTRSDVYSLGVLLYELLTGSTPFRREELLQAGLLEMQRVLREVEPQKPSTRIGTLGKTGGTVAAQRRVDLARLGTLLRGDLDWIVMKCLEKERGRRYESAIDLVRDVERHLAGEAVHAVPPSAVYRLRKFVRQHKAQVAAAAAVAVVAAVGLVALVWAEQKRTADAQQAAAAREFDAYVARIQAADAALANHDVRMARINLAACPKPLRQWEWHYLDAASDRSEFVMEGHTAPVRFVAYDQKGERLVTASDDGTARLWDPRTGEARGVLAHGMASVKKAQFHPDGRWVATATEVGEVVVWDATSLAKVATLVAAGAEDASCDFAWSPEGRQVAAVVRGGPATLWTVDAWQRRELEAQSKHDHVLFAPETAQLVTWAENYLPTLWDAESAERVTTFSGPLSTIQDLRIVDRWCSAQGTDGVERSWSMHGPVADAVSTAQLGRRMGCGPNIYATENGHVTVGHEMLEDELVGHRKPVVYAAALGAEDRVVTASPDATARLWLGEREVALFLGHIAPITHAAVRADEHQLATVAEDHTCRLWNLQLTWEQRHQLLEADRVPGNWIYGLEHGPEGESILVAELLRRSILLTGTSNLAARLWGYSSTSYWHDANSIVSRAEQLERIDARSGAQLQNLVAPPHVSRTESLGEHLLLLAEDHVEVRRLQADETLFVRSDATCATLGCTGALLALATKDGTIEIHDLDANLLRQTLGPTGAKVANLAFTADGTRLASLDTNGNLVEWVLAVGSKRAHATADPQVRPVWDPTGRWIAFRANYHLALLDTASGNCLAIQTVTQGAEGAGFHEKHGGEQFSFSPDGRRMVSTLTGDKVASVFDTATGREVFRLPRASSARARFSPDGTTIATCSMDAAVQWDGVPHRVRLQQTGTLRAALERAHTTERSAREVMTPQDRRAQQIRQAARQEQVVADARSAVETVKRSLIAYPAERDLDLEALSHQLGQAIELGVAQDWLGRAHDIVRFRQGMFAEAAARFASRVASVDMFAPHPVDVAFLAMAQSRLGDRSHAEASLAELMELDPLTLGGDFGTSRATLQEQAQDVFSECFPNAARQPPTGK